MIARGAVCAAFVTLGLYLVACPPAAVPAPTIDSGASFEPMAVDAGEPDARPAPAPADAAIEALGPPIKQDACARACLVLQSLGCPEARPTPNHKSCADVCRAVEGVRGMTLHPGAVAACGSMDCVRRSGVSCR